MRKGDQILFAILARFGLSTAGIPTTLQVRSTVHQITCILVSKESDVAHPGNRYEDEDLRTSVDTTDGAVTAGLDILYVPEISATLLRR